MMEFARDGSWASRFFDAAEERTLLRLAAEVAVAAREVEILSGPTQTMAPMEVCGESGVLFFVGNVLTTSCEVAVDGIIGRAAILGDDPKRAEASAILDAALQGPANWGLLEAMEIEERRMRARREASVAALPQP